MRRNNSYRRGEIWWVTLDPTVGFETKKTRPCLILQNDAGNKISRVTTVAPLLSVKKLKFIVNIEKSEKNGLDKDRGIHLNQIRAVDSSRVKNKLGEIEEEYWSEIEKAIAVQLGFFPSGR